MQSQINAGVRLLGSGFYAEAFDRFAQAIAEGQAFAQGDSTWADAHRGLARAAMELGRMEVAEQAARTALDTDQMFWGMDCVPIAEDALLLGEILRRRENFLPARSLFERALSIFSREFGDTNQQTMNALGGLVGLLLESNHDNGLEPVHLRAFAAYQSTHMTGQWAKFIGLENMLQRYFAAGRMDRIERIMQRELSMLKHSIGGSHIEINGVLECQRAVLRSSNRGLAAWRVESRTHLIQKCDTDSLFFTSEFHYHCPLSATLLVLDKILQAPPRVLPANAPLVLEHCWWQVNAARSNLPEGRISARMVYSDGKDQDLIQHGPQARAPMATPADIELDVFAGPEIERPGSFVRYQWRLHHSNRIALARAITNFLFHEVQETIATLPAERTPDRLGTVVPRHGDAGILHSPQSFATSLQSMHDSAESASEYITHVAGWPTPQAYNEAVQNPLSAFRDSSLQSSQTELNVLGLPRPLSGAFATVYRLRSDGADWAVKCFTQKVSDHQMRYQAITSRLHHLQLPFFTDFEYQSDGIRLGASSFPLVKMGWVEGALLNAFITSHLDEPSRLRQLLQSFVDLMEFLNYLGIAHGDLQHGNILVNNDDLILVDYDGMFVPELAGKQSNEIGHPNYQHPRRTAEYFDASLDNFSAWVIYVSIFAICQDRGLWEQLHAGDDALLFKRADFLDPEHSATFKCLLGHGDPDIRKLSRMLHDFALSEAAETPRLCPISRQ